MLQYFRQLQAHTIHSLCKLAQVNYFQVKNFYHFAQNKFLTKFSYGTLNYAIIIRIASYLRRCLQSLIITFHVILWIVMHITMGMSMYVPYHWISSDLYIIYILYTVLIAEYSHTAFGLGINLPCQVQG